MLDSEDSRLRQSGAEILAVAGRTGLQEAAEKLLKAADDQRGLDSWPARITAGEMLLNDLAYSRQAIDTIMEALDYGRHPLVVVPNAAEIRKMAALALGKLKAEEYRSEIAEKLLNLMTVEEDHQVLDALYQALLSLASAPT